MVPSSCLSIEARPVQFVKALNTLVKIMVYCKVLGLNINQQHCNNILWIKGLVEMVQGRSEVSYGIMDYQNN